MAVFAEGIESLKLACSLVLLIPALGIALMGKRRTILVPVWIIVVVVTAWLGFTGWFAHEASGLWHVLTGVALVAATTLAWRRNVLEADLAVTAIAAFIAGWTWVPCVGSELADILNNADDHPWSELFPTFLYLLGIFLPLVLLAALEIAWPQFGELIDHRTLRTVGLSVIALVGGLVAVSLFDDLAGELARRSSF